MDYTDKPDTAVQSKPQPNAEPAKIEPHSPPPPPPPAAPEEAEEPVEVKVETVVAAPSAPTAADGCSSSLLAPIPLDDEPEVPTEAKKEETEPEQVHETRGRVRSRAEMQDSCSTTPVEANEPPLKKR